MDYEDPQFPDSATAKLPDPWKLHRTTPVRLFLWETRTPLIVVYYPTILGVYYPTIPDNPPFAESETEAGQFL